VRITLPTLRRVLQDGAHPAVKAVIEAQPFVAVDGFDGVNVNAPADLDPLDAGRPGDSLDEHARLFAFENDFVRTLRCIPMCVRFKLDHSGIKLTLRQWSRFTLNDRGALRLQPCATAAQAAAYREALIALVLHRSGEAATVLETPGEAAWEAVEVPVEVSAFARARSFLTPSPAQWRRLTTLERYTLVKLSRDKHENANFEPALREFGVTGPDDEAAASPARP
jgi:hypothetical protein